MGCRIKIDRQYKRAYNNAPPEIKARIRKFMKQPKKFRENIPLLYFVLGEGQGTPPFKMSKRVAEYEDISKVRSLVGIRNCGNCEFQYLKTIRGKYICSQMRGEIKPEGWCKLWKPNPIAYIKKKLSI